MAWRLVLFSCWNSSCFIFPLFSHSSFIAQGISCEKIINLVALKLVNKLLGAFFAIVKIIIGIIYINNYYRIRNDNSSIKIRYSGSSYV